MDEHRPAGRADQPGDGHAAAVRPQPVAALAAAHPVGRAAAIELRAALAEAEHGPVAQVERETRRSPVDADLLDEPAIRRLDADRERLGRDGQPPLAAA